MSEALDDSDEAFTEWFADVLPPNGEEPVDLTPHAWAKAAWQELRSRYAADNAGATQ